MNVVIIVVIIAVVVDDCDDNNNSNNNHNNNNNTTNKNFVFETQFYEKETQVKGRARQKKTGGWKKKRFPANKHN